MRKNAHFSGLFRCVGSRRSAILSGLPARISAYRTALPTGGTVTFEVGDKVIYPNHGLGIVTRIEEKTILGTTCGFYHLRIVANETTVLVPVSNVDGVGLRRAISDEEVERLFGLLGDGKIDNHQNWKGRFKDNSDKMRSGSIYDVADVLKSLTFLAKSKSLSFREKRMLDRAKFLIISEVSEVMRETAPAIEARVDRALERCFTTKARTRRRRRERWPPPRPRRLARRPQRPPHARRARTRVADRTYESQNPNARARRGYTRGGLFVYDSPPVAHLRRPVRRHLRRSFPSTCSSSAPSACCWH